MCQMIKRKVLFCLLVALSAMGLVLIMPPVLHLAADELTIEETAELERQLQAIQQEINQYEQELSSVRSEKNTLTRKINELKVQQNRIKAQIKQSNLNIEDIEGKQVKVEQDIQERQEKMAGLNERIAGLLQLVNKRDHYSWLLILMSRRHLGGFFNELTEYKKVMSGLTAVVQEIKTEQRLLVADQEKLEEQKEEESNLIAIANLQNQGLAQNLAERNNLLTKTKATESNYQAMLSDRQKIAAEIRGRIYELLGISEAVTFGEALAIARWAEGLSGVRAAFLLAVLTQESNLGKNVGTCNRPGDPPEKSWKVVMKPERDQEPFLAITAELGMNPDVTPVSCPMKDKKGNQIGWGGAMGPAQFIPSTWQKYKGQVSALTVKTANPWDIRDAFLAAAILLKANGGDSEKGEWAAAMRYFSGGTSSRYRFYGDNVVEIAEKYQQDIEELQ